MRSFRALPVPLLALLFTLPVLSEPLTQNDPFHDIAAKIEKEPEPPICCLRPLAPLENTEEDVLLSFEEWKAKQVAGTGKDRTAGVHPAAPPVSQPKISDNGSVANVSLEQTGAGPSTATLEQTEAPVPDAPYFSIPLTDRFNYASVDCSARVHTAHKSAKSLSSILSSKKDRYMLSPCAEKKQYVVVELCDDIRIDTVQLANYEFFSGVFKDFTVSVAKTYTTDPSAWTFAGTYRAKNVRGVQSFHPPTTLGDFYRFIRVDFHSHYGNEYYCPLSLLRVYGLTHLEHWKWEVWEAESRAKQTHEKIEILQSRLADPPEESTVSSRAWSDLLPEPPVRAVPTVPVEITPIFEVHSDVPSMTTSPSTTRYEETTTDNISVPPSPYIHSTSVDVAAAHIVGAPDGDVTTASENTPASSPVSETSTDSSNDHLRQHATDSLYTTIAISEAHQPTIVSLLHSVSALSNPSSSHSGSSHSSSSSSVSSSANQSASLTRSSSASSGVPTVAQSLTVVPPAPPVTSGESIYRTIMNRLTALESNSSLYARFVEEHAASVREMLRRLSEDIGRLEGIGKAQAQMYQRSVSQFERQQRRLELEHNELLSKVGRLTDEVVLEKRLGIAQLCLLLAVLVFMALTRGSRSEPLPGPTAIARSRTSSLRGWGRRTLNLSGDWVSRFRTRSLSPASTSGKTETTVQLTQKLNGDVEFPSQGVQAGEVFPRSKRQHPITGGRKVGVSARPRTPSSARTHHFRHSSPSQASHPTTPTTSKYNGAMLSSGATLRPPIQRSHSSAISQSLSMGVIGPVPKSARRWARTAHLHEVKLGPLGTSKSEEGTQRAAVYTAQENGHANGRTGGDVFDREPVRAAPVQTVVSLLSPVEVDVGEGDGWVDTDADESEAELMRGS